MGIGYQISNLCPLAVSGACWRQRRAPGKLGLRACQQCCRLERRNSGSWLATVGFACSLICLLHIPRNLAPSQASDINLTLLHPAAVEQKHQSLCSRRHSSGTDSGNWRQWLECTHGWFDSAYGVCLHLSQLVMTVSEC